MRMSHVGTSSKCRNYQLIIMLFILFDSFPTFNTYTVYSICFTTQTSLKILSLLLKEISLRIYSISLSPLNLHLGQLYRLLWIFLKTCSLHNQLLHIKTSTRSTETHCSQVKIRKPVHTGFCP